MKQLVKHLQWFCFLLSAVWLLLSPPSTAVVVSSVWLAAFVVIWAVRS